LGWIVARGPFPAKAASPGFLHIATVIYDPPLTAFLNVTVPAFLHLFLSFWTDWHDFDPFGGFYLRFRASRK